MMVRPVRFFALTFFLSWLVWIPLALSHFGIGPLHIPEGTSNLVRLLGVLMPAVSALVLTAQSGGKEALRALFARLTLWRVGWQWWLAAVFVQPALLCLAALVFNLFSSRSTITFQPLISGSAFAVNVVMLLIATLGEEVGWRGVALPGLQERNSALTSSTVLGMLWAAWHVPFWLLLDSFDQFGVGYLFLNFLFVFPLTFYISWFFNHSRQSLLLPVMFHLTFNIVNTVLLPVTVHLGAFIIFVVLEWMAAFLVLPHLEDKPVQAAATIT